MDRALAAAELARTVNDTEKVIVVRPFLGAAWLRLRTCVRGTRPQHAAWSRVPQSPPSAPTVCLNDEAAPYDLAGVL